MGMLGRVVARVAVAFGAACAGMFVGLVGFAVLMPFLGPAVASPNAGVAAGIGLAVAGAVASLTVSVTPLLRRS